MCRPVSRCFHQHLQPFSKAYNCPNMSENNNRCAGSLAKRRVWPKCSRLTVSQMLLLHQWITWRCYMSSPVLFGLHFNLSHHHPSPTSSYLTVRLRKVTTKVSTFILTTGVPQGCVSGALAYSPFSPMNDLDEKSSSRLGSKPFCQTLRHIHSRDPLQFSEASCVFLIT